MPAKGFKLLDAYVEVHGDASGAVREATNQIDNDGGRARMSGLEFGKRLVAGIIGSIVVAKIGSYLKSSIESASDLNETINKSSVIFGKNQQVMLNWSENAATSLGLSQAAALDAASQFGDMFTQLGFTGDAAAEMSQKVVQAAADLGSFSNLDTADVAERIQAAFRGEYDSLQLLIPNINAARVETEALTMTGKANASELTAQEKAAAVLAIVYADGSRAMGDFGRTSEGFANQMKIASAQSADLKAKIGDALLPVAASFAGVLTSQVMPALSLLADAYLPRVAEQLQGVAEWMAQLDLVNFNNGVVTLGTSWDGFLTKIQPVVDVITTLAPLILTLKDALAPLVPIIVEELSPYLPILATAFAYVITQVTPLIPKILELIPPLVELAVNLVPALVDLLGTLLPPAIALVQWAIDNLIPPLVYMIDSLKGAMQAGEALFKLLDGSMSMQEFQRVTANAGGAVGFFQTAMQILGSIVGHIIADIIINVRNFANEWISRFSAALDFVRNFPGMVRDAVGNLGGVLFGAGQSVVSGFIRGIQSMISDVVATLQRLTSLIPANKGPIERDRVLLRPNGRAIIESLVDGFQSKEPDIRAYLGDLTMSLQAAAPGAPGLGFDAVPAKTKDDGSTAGGNIYNFEPGSIVLDASNIKDFSDIVDMLNELPQTARAGAGTPVGK